MMRKAETPAYTVRARFSQRFPKLDCLSKYSRFFVACLKTADGRENLRPPAPFSLERARDLPGAKLQKKGAQTSRTNLKAWACIAGIYR